MGQLNVEMVATDGKVFEGEARQVTVRAVEGDMGVLPGHAPTLAALAEGEVKVSGAEGSGDTTVHIDGGFMTVDEDRVTIVAEKVTRADQASARA